MPRLASTGRDDGEDRQYSREKLRSQAGCGAARMQRDCHQGLLAHP